MTRRAVAALVAVLSFAGCGGGGGGSAPLPPPPPEPPAILSVTGPLEPATGPTVTVTGVSFPGADGDDVEVVFTAEDGLPLSVRGTPELRVAGRRVSETSVTAALSPFPMTRSVDVSVDVRFPGGLVLHATPGATRFTGVPDASLDQDLDGVTDACDPNTYTFEEDAVGAAPAEVSGEGDGPALMVVRDVGGDRAAAFGAVGQTNAYYERLDRCRADVPFQDVTVYADVEMAPAWWNVELWNEGTFLGAAGAGIIVQVQPSGQITYYQRLWNQIVLAVNGPVIHASGRMRLRLVKGEGSTSTLHIDNGPADAWAVDAAVIPILDDHAFRGLETRLAAYGGGARGLKRITVVHGRPAAMMAIAKSTAVSSDWQLFPRSATGTATVPVRVLHRHLGEGRLEARVVRSATGEVLDGHDFPDHGRALTAADRGRVDLAVTGVPAGGNYDVQVRLVDGGGGVLGQDALLDVAVGDVWVAAGQSNMSGYSGTLFGAETPTPRVHVFHNDGTWKQAAEPMDEGTEQVDLISRETPAASLMLAFGKELELRTGVPVAIVPTSLGGTNLYAQWQRDAVRHASRITLYGSMVARTRIACGGGQARGLLWFQGESDAIAGRTAAQYRADLERLLAQAREDLATPALVLLTGQLGTYDAATPASWLPIQEAQRQVAEAEPLSGLVPAIDLPRADGIHFSVAGYVTLGRRFATAARRLVFGHGVDERTDLVACEAGVAPATIQCTWERAVTGGEAALFTVSDDAGAVAVTAVATSGATVTLTLARELSTHPVLSYGFSTTPTRTWVRDASGVPVPCFDQVPEMP